MSDVIRITNHPTTDGALLVFAGPTLAELMGRYPYARWSPVDGAYLLHAEALPGLTRHAEREQVRIVDDRSRSATAAANPPDPRGRARPQECRACGQPGPWEDPPARCPSCGRPWDPVPPPADPVTERRDWATCEACGHGQAAHWAYCSACGHPMPQAGPSVTRPAITLPGDHTRLDDPLPLATTVDQVLDHLGEQLGDQVETTDNPQPATTTLVKTPQHQQS